MCISESGKAKETESNGPLRDAIIACQQQLKQKSVFHVKRRSYSKKFQNQCAKMKIKCKEPFQNIVLMFFVKMK
ncbi:hypothetical protein T01_10324 [Trichinella spiralis]|uniref:Uncharacterized protein n=1 Tax=Trichinella spiralis TaxID=6334 RepID=A0A0V1BXH7_TRISP|nr:hypothetical protein T01_10324 [Trichinella spiralis]